MLSALTGRFKRALGAGAVAAAFGLLVGASPAVAQDGAVAGQVVDASTMGPIAGAQVFVQGTQLGGLTNQDGRYRITGVPAGQQTVMVQLIGYKAASQTVSVSAGEVATADFELEQTALKLQEVVVTGVAGETPKVKLPFSVESVSAEEAPVPSSNASTLIRGKIAGASVVQGSGQPGSEASIMFRGPTSIDASGRSQGPLIVVDGVIMGQNASLANINALDIKNIEVVKGAAAASLYGSRAQNGVIQITTKRGTQMDQNQFDLTFRAEAGRNELADEIELSRFHHFQVNPNPTSAQREDGLLYLDQNGNPTTYADDDKALDKEPFDGLATTMKAFRDNGYPEQQLYDQVDRFFKANDVVSVYAAGSGRFGNTNFRVSGETYSQEGVLFASSGYDRKNIRVNLDNSPSENFDLSVSGFYSSSQQDEIDQFAGGPFFSLTFMPPNIDLLARDDEGELILEIPGSQEGNPIYELINEEQSDDRQRVMGSGNLRWSPAGWLDVEGTFSYDRTDNLGRQFFPKGYKTLDPNPDLNDGNLTLTNSTNEALNAQVRATVTKQFMDGDLTTRTKAQVLAEEQESNFLSAAGSEFATSNTPVLSNATATENINSGLSEIRSMGYYLITAVDYKSKYIADALFRRDGSSLFGSAERWNNYFRLSGAYRVSQESWWPLAGAVPEFKVRASYGTAGARPNFSAQYETFSVGSGTVSFGTLGNNDLKPELAKEQEYGINAVLYDRLSLDLTYAVSNIEDQIMNVSLPGYWGYASQWRNAGELHSETWEASLNASVIEQPEMTWNVQVNWSKTQQEISHLDEEVPRLPWGLGFFNREGEELGSFYGDRWASNCSELPTELEPHCGQFATDSNGLLVWVGEGNSPTDGFSKGLWGSTTILENNTLIWGQPVKASVPEESFYVPGFLPMGNTTPDHNLSLSSNFSWKGLQVYALFDGAFGHEQYWQTGQWGMRENMLGITDQFGKPDELKKPVGYYQTLYNVNAINSWFVEDGTYVKLRELSLGYQLSDSLVQDLFGGKVQSIQLNLIGRNLLTWTDWPGYDPEVGTGGGQAGAAAINRTANYNYPNFRELTGSIQLVF